LTGRGLHHEVDKRREGVRPQRGVGGSGREEPDEGC
jgi:hypothetical protein